MKKLSRVLTVIVLMLAAVGVGCFFKETVLVGVILCLFNREWKWHWQK